MSENHKVVVKSKTVKRWVKNAMDGLSEATIKVGGIPINKPEMSPEDGPDDAIDLRARSGRRMPPYRGKEERRPAPRTSFSDTGITGQKQSEIARDLDDPRIKVGDYTYKASRDREANALDNLRGQIATLRADMSKLQIDINNSFERKKAGEDVPDIRQKIEKYKSMKSQLERLKAEEPAAMAGAEELRKHREDYESWVPSDAQGRDRSRYEFTSEDLPVGHRAIKSNSGIALDVKKGLNKIKLSLGDKGAGFTGVPEYVIQMLVKAVKDYKETLKEPISIIKLAVHDYAKDLMEDADELTPELKAELGVDPSEGNLSKEEKKELKELLQSDAGIVALAESPEFVAYFERWKQGSYKSPHGGPSHPGAPPKVSKRADPRNPQGISAEVMKSALKLVQRLKTLDVDNPKPSKYSLPEELALETLYDPQLTRVEAYLLHDPAFRYFLEEGDYWDWVRNHAEKEGYKGEF